MFFLVSCCTLGVLKHDAVAFVSISLAAKRCLQLPQQVRGASLVLGERGRCNLECRDLSAQTARRRGGWRHYSQCFSISGVASVLGTSNSLTVGGSSILSVNVNLGDVSADAIAITGDGTFSNGIITSGDVTLGGAVSDVGTVNSLTAFGNTTLSANVAWVRRAPTLHGVGQKRPALRRRRDDGGKALFPRRNGCRTRTRTTQRTSIAAT